MAECIGIVGVGLMGQAFSHHLLQSGSAPSSRSAASAFSMRA